MKQNVIKHVADLNLHFFHTRQGSYDLFLSTLFSFIERFCNFQMGIVENEWKIIEKVKSIGTCCKLNSNFQHLYVHQSSYNLFLPPLFQFFWSFYLYFQETERKMAWQNVIRACCRLNLNFHFLYMHQGSYKLFLPHSLLNFPCFV